MITALLFALLATAVGDDPIAALVKQARATKSDQRVAAYDALLAQGEAGRAALEPVLREAEKSANEALQSLMHGSVAASFRSWMKKEIETGRREALKIIRDEKAYPDDAHGAVGQPLVDAAVNKVRELWSTPGKGFAAKVPEWNAALDRLDETTNYLHKMKLKSTGFDGRAAATAELDRALDPRDVMYTTPQLKKIEEIDEYNATAAMSATEEERKFAKLLNDYRAMLGLSPVELDDRLVNSCRKHSQEMCEMNYFSHVSPVAANKTAADRAHNEGFKGSVLENVAISDDARDVFDGWYTSAGHHRAYVADGVMQLGIGEWIGKEGGHGHQWTMELGTSDSLRGKAHQNPLQSLALRRAQLKPDDVDGRLALAEWCVGHDLGDEAAKLCDEVLKLAPDRKEAHQMLGHVQVDGKWMSVEEQIAQQITAGKLDDALASIAQRMKNKSAHARKGAIDLTKQIDDPRVTRILIAALKDDATEIRIVALDRIGALVAKDAATSIKPLLGDDSFYVKHAAAAALHHLGDDRGVPVIFQGLRSPDLNTRDDAHQRGLEIMGQDFGFQWDLPEVQRAKVVDQWEAWWKSKGGAKSGAG